MGLKLIFHFFETGKNVISKMFHILMNFFYFMQKAFHFGFYLSVTRRFHTDFQRLLRLVIDHGILLHSIGLLEKAPVILELFNAATSVSQCEFLWRFLILDFGFVKLDMAETEALSGTGLTDGTLRIVWLVVFYVTDLLPNFSVIWHF